MPSEYETTQHETGVWLASDGMSVARKVAVDAMRALTVNPDDFRMRDKIILAISDRINGSIDCALAARVAELEGAVSNDPNAQWIDAALGHMMKPGSCQCDPQTGNAPCIPCCAVMMAGWRTQVQEAAKG